MQFPSKYIKLMPILLIIGPIIFLTADQIEYNLKQPQKINSRMVQHEEFIHDHDKEKTDHRNPETQKRMGIFHYNEGNKFLKQNKSEEAIRNYKMALHHNKSFEEAYINLSTAYLRKKNFILSKKNLKTLYPFDSVCELLVYPRTRFSMT